MTSKRSPLLALGIAAAISITACTGSSGDTAVVESPSAPAIEPSAAPVTDAPSTSEPPDTAASEPTTTDAASAATDAPATTDGDSSSTAAAPADLDARIAKGLELLASGYRTAEGVWAGFDPNEHPTVLPLKTAAGDVVGAVAINHPAPDALGDATAIDTTDMPFTSAHRIDNPTDAERMKQIVNFEFHAQLGGVDSFALNANATDQGDSFFDMTTRDFTATLLHEMFHRYQDTAFTGSLGAQDVNGYAYTPENLGLAALEERALKAVLTATSDADREAAARRFAAIRLQRRDADRRVELDDSQEMFEGTARYLEHRVAGDDDSYAYHAGNFDADLFTNIGAGVKDVWGFGRFYSSGAAILATLDLLGVDGVPGRVEAGESPADILIDELGLTTADTAKLVAEAKSNYDPTNELAGQAETASKVAADEPDPFGDVDGSDTSDSSDADAAGAGGGGEITQEQVECFADLGVDVDDEDTEITQEQFETCVG